MINRIFRFFAALLTLFSLYLSVSSLIAPLTGDRFQFLALSGLFMPFSLILSTFLLIFWLLKKSLWSLGPILSILFSLGYINTIFQFPEFTRSKPVNEENGLCISTYNVQGFKYGMTELTIRLMADFMKDNKVDILCLQEFDEETTRTATNIIESQDFLPYHTIFPGEKPGFSLALYSNFPICQSKSIHFEQEGNQAMWADIVLKKDTVRIFNVHLQTTNFNQTKYKLKGGNWFWDMSGETKKTISMIDKLLFNEQKRTVQASIIKTLIEESPYPMLVCGDMNSNPASNVYRLMTAELNDGFQSAGSGYEYTYRYLFNLYRTDYIFHSDRFEGLTYTSYNLVYSDHKPVIMKLALTPALKEFER